jgi:uncharacterized protein YjbI with pentapeptide repeats
MVFQRQIGGANEHDDLIEKIQEGIALTDQEKTQLSGIVLDGISFADGYDLSGADFSEATFIGINDLGEPRVNFENAIFTRATFRDDCYFPNAVFNGASFAEAKLKEVEFRHASFGGHVDFTRTRLYDVVFDCSPDSEIGTIDFTESRWKNVTICPSYPSNTPRETRRAFFNRSVFTNVNMTNTIILGAFEVDMQYILSRFTATQRSQISFHVVVDEVPQDEENTEAGYLNTDVPGNVPEGDEDDDVNIEVPPSGLGRSEATIPYRARGTDPVGLEYDIPVREFLENQDHADHVAIQLHRDIFILDTSDVRRLYRAGTRYECYEANSMHPENINRRPAETLFNLKATGVPLDGYVYLSEIKAVVETRPSRYYTLVATHKEVVSVVSADVMDHAGSFVGAGTSHCQDGQGGQVYRIMVATLGQPSPKPRKTRLKLPLRSSQSRKPKTLKKLIKTTKTTLKRGTPNKKKRTLRNYYRSHSHSHT